MENQLQENSEIPLNKKAIKPCANCGDSMINHFIFPNQSNFDPYTKCRDYELLGIKYHFHKTIPKYWSCTVPLYCAGMLKI